ncbi:MAG: hypothetical protein IRZ09_06875 [Variibacter sp.]|nr:hypothetical protein [Variibacter sp.]
MSMPPAAAVESDLAALTRAAERAGTALACLFSSAAEFEAELIRARRAQGYYRPRRARGARLRRAALSLALAFVLLMF